MMASSISPMEFCELVKLSRSSEIVGIRVTKPTNVTVKSEEYFVN